MSDGTVKIRMLTKGPNGNFKKGQLVTVDKLRAAALLASKDAEEVKEEDVRTGL
jgi:hypothetical protein